MYRYLRGGVFLFISLFISINVHAQIKIISAKNGQPVKDALVCFTGERNKQSVCFSDVNGFVLFPPFQTISLVIVAEGYALINDLVKEHKELQYTLTPLQFDLNEVVITGQYQANKISNSVYQVELFSQNEIEQRAANNLSDLLQHENNINLSHDPFLGTGININGISGNNVKILMDGVPVIGRENGNIDLSQLDLNNISSVEIVKGPMSETFGSDAIAGVINLISKKIKTEGFSGGGKFYYESNGTFNVNANAGLLKNKNEITFHIGRNFFDGYATYDTLRSKPWKPKEQYTGDLGYTYHFKNGSLKYLGNISSETLICKGNIIATPYEAYAFDDYYQSLRHSHKLLFELGFKNKSSINLSNTWSNYERSRISYRKDMVTLTQSGLDANNYSNLYRQYHLRGSYTTNKSWKKINYQTGYELSFDESKGDRTGEVTRNINDFALFGSTEITLFKNFIIRPASRLIYNSKYKAPVVPSLNIKYSPIKNITIRGSFARGFRAPTVKELYLDFEDSNHNLRGNTTLKPELSNFAQLSVNFQTKIKNLMIALNPDVFYNHLYNKISLAQVNGNALEYTYINIDDYRNLGSNINVSFTFKSLAVSTGVSIVAYKHAYNSVETNTGFNQSTNYNGSVSYFHEKSGFSAGLYFKHNGPVKVFTVNDNEVTSFKVNSYNTMDFTLSKTFFKKSLTCNTGIKNIFNVTSTTGSNDDNIAHGGSQEVTLLGMGRYYFGGISVNIAGK